MFDGDKSLRKAVTSHRTPWDGCAKSAQGRLGIAQFLRGLTDEFVWRNMADLAAAVRMYG